MLPCLAAEAIIELGVHLPLAGMNQRRGFWGGCQRSTLSNQTVNACKQLRVSWLQLQQVWVPTVGRGELAGLSGPPGHSDTAWSETSLRVVDRVCALVMQGQHTCHWIQKKPRGSWGVPRVLAIGQKLEGLRAEASSKAAALPSSSHQGLNSCTRLHAAAQLTPHVLGLLCCKRGPRSWRGSGLRPAAWPTSFHQGFNRCTRLQSACSRATEECYHRCATRRCSRVID